MFDFGHLLFKLIRWTVYRSEHRWVNTGTLTHRLIFSYKCSPKSTLNVHIFYIVHIYNVLHILYIFFTTWDAVCFAFIATISSWIYPQLVFFEGWYFQTFSGQFWIWYCFQVFSPSTFVTFRSVIRGRNL